MSAVLGTIRNGQVKLDQASPWPEGKRVKIADATVETVEGFMTEEEQGTDPESIARWIQWYRDLPPLPLSKEEEQRMEAAIKEMGGGSYINDQDISELTS